MREKMGWVMGLEPTTPGATDQYSDQLSYTHRFADHLLYIKTVPVFQAARISAPAFVYNFRMANHTETLDKGSLTRYAWLSIAAALVTMALKSAAYMLTGSVGLLSDAMESLVNMAGAIMALAMLRVAEQPEDEAHAYGHGKAEYFSSGFEGALILIAALGIAYEATVRLLHPKPLEQIGMGLAISVVASLINLAVALVLMRAAKRRGSITLKADSQHLLTDVWTSVGVVIGVGMVAVTGWQILDPIVAFIVAANIIWVGGGIVFESIHGLMDISLPPAGTGRPAPHTRRPPKRRDQLSRLPHEALGHTEVPHAACLSARRMDRAAKP